MKDFTNVIATLDPEAPRRCFLLKDFPPIVVLVLVHQFLLKTQHKLLKLWLRKWYDKKSTIKRPIEAAFDVNLAWDYHMTLIKQNIRPTKIMN